MEQFESHTLMVGGKKYNCFSKIFWQFIIVLNVFNYSPRSKFLGNFSIELKAHNKKDVYKNVPSSRNNKNQELERTQIAIIK